MRLLVTTTFPPALGGIESTLWSLARCLSPGVTVLTQPTPGDRAFDSSQPFRVLRRPFYERRHYPTWWGLKSTLLDLCRRDPPQQVIFGHYGPYAVVADQLKALGIPSVVYCHGLDALAYTATAGHRWLLRRILRSLTVVVANSAWTARQLEPYVPAWRVAVVHPPVEPDSCPASPPADAPHLLSVGRLVPIKGYDVALAAVARLTKDFPEIRYTIIGDGPEEENLRSQIARLELTDHVTLKSSRTTREWCQDLQASAALVQPSRSILHPTFIQEESWGLAALQAGAAGRPVVATAVGGVPEAVIDGQTGLLVPPDDPVSLAQAISRLLNDPELRQGLGRAARERCRRDYRPESFAERWRAVVEKPHPPPKVSVCIPAWNAGATLADCLASVTAQDYPNLEWIVADDGSTDATPAIATRDPRVRLVRTEHLGAAAARNRAAAVATGDFLYFSDADCLHQPSAISTLMRALQNHPEAAFAYASFRLGWKLFRLGPYDRWRLRWRNYIPTRALIRREGFPGFDEGLRRLQDWDLWLTLDERGQPGIWVNEVLYQSAARARTISSGWFPKALYRFPRLADWLSRGAGLTLRQAEAIVRAKHPSRQNSLPPLRTVCPNCRGPLNGPPLRCPNCSTVYPDEHGVPVLIHPAWRDPFKEQEIAAHAPVSHWQPDQVTGRDAYFHRHFRKALEQLPPSSRILEVACGERPDTLELVPKGFPVVATDLAPARVARARDRAHRLGLDRRMTFLTADAEHLPFANSVYDAAVVAASFHHFPHPRNALHELRRVVRPGGLVILALEPQRWPYQTLWPLFRPLQRWFRLLQPAVVHSIGDDTTSGFSSAELKALCRNEGLTILELRRVKCLTEVADQLARLIGKFRGRLIEQAPVWLRRGLEPFDLALEHLPGARALFWHWTLIARVP